MKGMEMEEVGNFNGVTVEISGGDTVTVGLVASAVNHGLSECGFENVTIAVPDEVVCHPADENLLNMMQQAKAANPEPFLTEVDVVMSFDVEDDEVDEVPTSGAVDDDAAPNDD